MDPVAKVSGTGNHGNGNGVEKGKGGSKAILLRPEINAGGKQGIYAEKNLSTYFGYERTTNAST